MTLKKKLAVSTLAVSMAAASVAGFPFSSQGLAKHLNGVASAASSNDVIFTALKDRANVLYATLAEADKQILRDFRGELQGLTQAQLEADFAPVTDKLTFLTQADKSLLHKLYVEIVTSVYTPEYSAVTDIQKSENYQAYKDLVKKIAGEIGLPNLTVDEVYTSILGTNGVEQTLIPLFKGQSEAVILAALQDENSALFKQAKEATLKVAVGSSTVNGVLNGLNKFGVTRADLAAVKNNLENEASVTKEKAALLVLARAYYNAYLQAGGGNNGGGGGVASGGTTTTTLTPAEAFAKASIFDASKYVVITGDKATVKLVDADILAAFDKLVAAAKL